MKAHRILWMAAALLVLAAPSARADQAAFAAKVKSLDGLIGYWSFEGNYQDQTGRGNHGVPQGDTNLIKFCEGVKGGQGVQFDNETDTGQFITVKAPIGSVFDTPKLSVFIWAKVTSQPEPNKWDNLIDRTSLWYVETQWRELSDGSLKLDYVSRIYSPEEPQTAGTGQVRTSANQVYYNANEWHFYGFTYDGELFISYVDGKEVVRREYKGGVGPTEKTPREEDSRHGHYDINWGAFTQIEDWATGCFDDTVIYNRALTSQEVQALYDAMMQ